MTTTRVHVEFFGPDGSSWRLVEASDLGEGEYLLNFEPSDDERPAFQTGQRVRCEDLVLATGERVLAAVANVWTVPELRIVRGRPSNVIEVVSVAAPKPSCRPDLNEPFVVWLMKLSQTASPVRPIDDAIITGFVDVTSRKHYRVKFEISPGASPQRAARFLMESGAEFGFGWEVALDDLA